LIEMAAKGLAQGRTQTDAPWPHALQALQGHIHAPDLWFHDPLWPDGRAYDPAERDVVAHLAETASCAERKRDNHILRRIAECHREIW